MGPPQGLPHVAVSEVGVHPITQRIFAFTFGRGVFLLDGKALARPGHGRRGEAPELRGPGACPKRAPRVVLWTRSEIVKGTIDVRGCPNDAGRLNAQEV
jgi:hypothetical protein